MQHVWILSLFIVALFMGRWYYWQKLPKKEKLKKQILKEAKRIRRMMEDIEEKERKVAIIKRGVAQLIHQYRRE